MVARLRTAHSGVMTTIPPEAPSADSGHGDPQPDAGPRVTGAQMRNVARIRRTVHADRKVAGVAGGLARHLDVDPVLVRVGLVILAFFGGAGLLLYGALWLLLPEEGSDRAAINLDERSLMAALIGVSVLAGLLLMGQTWDGFWFPWPLAVILLVVVALVAGRNQGPAAGPAPGPPAYPSPYAAPGQPGPETPVVGPAPPVYAGPGVPYPPAPPRPRDPRKNGPILFWFTLALVALGIGLLGMVDVSGVDVPGSAYPALATAVVGVMLLVGSFFGRAGGLILLGLVAATALAGATVGENIDTRQDTVRPTTAAQVSDRYSRAAGELVVDLSDVRDPAALDGRDIRLESGVGRLVLILPDTVDVEASASVGAGEATVFGASRDGLGIELDQRRDVPDEDASVTVDVQLGVGEIEIRTQ